MTSATGSKGLILRVAWASIVLGIAMADGIFRPNRCSAGI